MKKKITVALAILAFAGAAHAQVTQDGSCPAGVTTCSSSNQNVGNNPLGSAATNTTTLSTQSGVSSNANGNAIDPTITSNPQQNISNSGGNLSESVGPNNQNTNSNANASGGTATGNLSTNANNSSASTGASTSNSGGNNLATNSNSGGNTLSTGGSNSGGNTLTNGSNTATNTATGGAGGSATGGAGGAGGSATGGRSTASSTGTNAQGQQQANRSSNTNANTTGNQRSSLAGGNQRSSMTGGAVSTGQTVGGSTGGAAVDASNHSVYTEKTIFIPPVVPMTPPSSLAVGNIVKETSACGPLQGVVQTPVEGTFFGLIHDTKVDQGHDDALVPYLDQNNQQQMYMYVPIRDQEGDVVGHRIFGHQVTQYTAIVGTAGVRQIALGGGGSSGSWGQAGGGTSGSIQQMVTKVELRLCEVGSEMYAPKVAEAPIAAAAPVAPPIIRRRVVHHRPAVGPCK